MKWQKISNFDLILNKEKELIKNHKMKMGENEIEMVDHKTTKEGEKENEDIFDIFVFDSFTIQIYFKFSNLLYQVKKIKNEMVDDHEMVNDGEISYDYMLEIINSPPQSQFEEEENEKQQNEENDYDLSYSNFFHQSKNQKNDQKNQQSSNHINSDKNDQKNQQSSNHINSDKNDQNDQFRNHQNLKLISSSGGSNYKILLSK